MKTKDKHKANEHTTKICGQGHIMREVKSSMGSYWICDHCGEMKN
jgi:hypothetical protein